MLPLLAALVLLAGARTPQEAVHRFIQPKSPADACAQLAPAYLKQTEQQYGPCIPGVARNPKATHLVLSHVVVNGVHAHLQAAYVVNGSPIRERYTLERLKHVWLITGARQL